MKEEIAETITDLRAKARRLKADVREMWRGPDERVLRPGSEQRPADHPEALVVALRSRSAADAADVRAMHTASCSSDTSRDDRDTRESQSGRSSANKHPVAPGEAAAQRTIHHDDPRQAAQAGPSAARGTSADSSHGQHVPLDPTPTPVSGISRGRAARTWQEARGSQSIAPALPQSYPSSAGVRVGRFYEYVAQKHVRQEARATVRDQGQEEEEEVEEEEQQ